MARDEDIPPPDQQLVLDELERLQQAIQTTREQRERAKAQLASHLTAFDPPVPRARPQQPQPAAPPAAGRAAREPRLEPAPAQAPSPPPIPTSSPAQVSDTFEPLPSLSRSPRELFGDDATTWGEPSARRSNRLPIAAGAIVALLAVVALFVWWPRGRAHEPANPGATAAVSPVPQQANPAPPPAPAPIVPAHPIEVVVDTLRPVWMRVTVDGTIALEQELPAGTKRTFGGDTAVVIRAGDAGALRLLVGGVDQGTLGRDGQVVTKRIEK